MAEQTTNEIWTPTPHLRWARSPCTKPTKAKRWWWQELRKYPIAIGYRLEQKWLVATVTLDCDTELREEWRPVPQEPEDENDLFMPVVVPLKTGGST